MGNGDKKVEGVKTVVAELEGLKARVEKLPFGMTAHQAALGAVGRLISVDARIQQVLQQLYQAAEKCPGVKEQLDELQKLLKERGEAAEHAGKVCYSYSPSDVWGK